MPLAAKLRLHGPPSEVELPERAPDEGAPPSAVLVLLLPHDAPIRGCEWAASGAYVTLDNFWRNRRRDGTKGGPWNCQLLASWVFLTELCASWAVATARAQRK